MKDLIFHIGLTKTASSFLQRRVFYGKMYTLRKNSGDIIDSESEYNFHRFFRSTSPKVWRTDNAKNYIQSFNKSGVPFLISNESVYEGTTEVFLFGEKANGRSIGEPYLIADRMREISNHCWNEGNVKVFFFFRKQPDWMASFYSHVCYRTEDPSQDDFDKRVEALLDNPYENGAPGLFYDLLTEELQDALGDQNVLALPYEKIRSNETWKKLREFTGIKNLGKETDFGDRLNVKRKKDGRSWSASSRAQSNTLSKLAINAKNVLGRYYSKMRIIRKIGSMLKNQEKRIRGEIEIKVEKHREKLINLFRKSNINMENYTKYNLKELGYY